MTVLFQSDVIQVMYVHFTVHQLQHLHTERSCEHAHTTQAEMHQSSSESDRQMLMSSFSATGITSATAAAVSLPAAPCLHIDMASTAACISLLLNDLSYTLSHMAGLFPIAIEAPISLGPSTAVELLLYATKMTLSF